jgi:hypothetical protein
VDSIGKAKDGGLTTVGTIKPAGLEVKIANITGCNAVITKQLGDTYYYQIRGYTNGSSIAHDDVVDTVYAYYAQDIDSGGGGGAGAICIMDDTGTTGADVGKKITAISGRIQMAMSMQENECEWNDSHYLLTSGFWHPYPNPGNWDCVGAIAVGSPVVTISTEELPVEPVALSLKALTCGDCVNQLPEGTGNVGRLARVFGRVTWVGAYSPTPGVYGSYPVIIDDGSGILNHPHQEGENAPGDSNALVYPDHVMAPALPNGLKVLIDLNTINPLGAYDDTTAPQLNDNLSVVGVVGYQSFWEYWKMPWTLTERALLYPVATKLSPPYP